MSSLPSPETLACPGAPGGWFLVALDTTGVTEVPVPEELLGSTPVWTESQYWTPAVSSPFEVVLPEHSAVLIRSFTNACQFGFGACTVEMLNGDTVLLTFWNRVAEHGCVVIAATERSIPGVGSESARHRPMRTVQHVDVFGITRRIDAATRESLGWGDEVLGASRLDYQHPDDVVQGMRHWSAVIGDADFVLAERTRFRAADGSYRWFECQARNRLSEVGLIEIEMIDITDYIEHLPSSTVVGQSLIENLAERVTDGVLILDSNDKVVACNEAFRRATGVAFDPVRRVPQWPLSTIAEELQWLITAARTERAGAREAIVTGTDGPMTVRAERSEDPDTTVVVSATVHDWSSVGDLPKGFSSETMARVLAALHAAPPGGSTFLEIAEATSTSEVTARRYVTLLHQSGTVTREQEYGTPGRPIGRYALTEREARVLPLT